MENYVGLLSNIILCDSQVKDQIKGEILKYFHLSDNKIQII